MANQPVQQRRLRRIADLCVMPDPVQPVHRTWASLKPSSLLDWWTIAVFLAAIAQLFLIRSLDIRILLLFLLPPLLAFAFKHSSERHSSRLVAALFLTSVSMGEILAHLPSLFPELGGVDSRLAPEQDRMLAWYVAVYLLYALMVLPLFLFIRGLIDHRRQRVAQFSRFTCVLGVLACLVVAPGLISVCCRFLHILPVMRT